MTKSKQDLEWEQGNYGVSESFRHVNRNVLKRPEKVVRITDKNAEKKMREIAANFGMTLEEYLEMVHGKEEKMEESGGKGESKE